MPSAHEKSRPEGRLFRLARNAIIAWQPEPKQQRPKQPEQQRPEPKRQQQLPKRPGQQQPVRRPEPKLPGRQPEQRLLPSYRKQPEPRQPSAKRSGETFSFFRSLTMESETTERATNNYR
ncbi:hypothetical protein HTZ98_00585 [Ralstonia solanacearum]|nr:hypothetical protein [Ralstonia solanacearum]